MIKVTKFTDLGPFEKQGNFVLVHESDTLYLFTNGKWEVQRKDVRDWMRNLYAAKGPIGVTFEEFLDDDERQE